MNSDFIWVEKYRPKTIEDCILPENIKKTFMDFLNKGEISNMLLAFLHFGPDLDRNIRTTHLAKPAGRTILKALH